MLVQVKIKSNIIAATYLQARAHVLLRGGPVQPGHRAQPNQEHNQLYTINNYIKTSISLKPLLLFPTNHKRPLGSYKKSILVVGPLNRKGVKAGPLRKKKSEKKDDH